VDEFCARPVIVRGSDCSDTAGEPRRASDVRCGAPKASGLVRRCIGLPCEAGVALSGTACETPAGVRPPLELAAARGGLCGWLESCFCDADGVRPLAKDLVVRRGASSLLESEAEDRAESSLPSSIAAAAAPVRLKLGVTQLFEAARSICDAK
jgi:hypothetical protein